MSIRNHYDALGVSKVATQEEIKTAFRKLSLATHPDVAKNADGEAFKVVAAANSVLSSPTERVKYDLLLQEATMWRPRQGPGQGGNWYGGNNMGRPGQRPPPRGSQVFIETLSNPRYILFGVVAFGSVFALSALMGGVSSRQPEYYQDSLVKAWKNPNTGRWEQPAPWDPLYRKLNPKLELVPREKVRRRNM
jgi:curved DNA-binding protein CbpA